jgi:glycerol-3-phosphate dehydrogenase (NAD(P)+)
MRGGVDLLILGVSSVGVLWAIDRIVEVVVGALPVLMLTKGLLPKEGSIEVLPVLVAREVEARTGVRLPVMAVGGPCIAGELAAKRDTAVVIAGDNRYFLDRIIGSLDTPYYHAHPSEDVIGVEVCAAFKNFYAIGVGSANGMLERIGRAPNGALMHNLTAALFAQALAELSFLVAYLGGDQASVAGLPGTGDLYVTCQAGRNYRMGRLLGLGLTYSRAKSDYMALDTVEGADLALALGPTLDALMSTESLPRKHMPLTRAIIDVICRDQPLDPSWQSLCGMP